MRSQARRGGEWALCSPECVPLPNNVRGPKKLLYTGLLRELCKTVQRCFAQLALTRNTPVNALHHICESHVRRMCVIAQIGRIVSDGFEATDAARDYRREMIRIVTRAEECLPGHGDPDVVEAYLVPAANERARQGVARARDAVCAAETLTLEALDAPDALALRHIATLLARMHDAALGVRDAVGALGYRRESASMTDLLVDLQLLSAGWIRPGFESFEQPARDRSRPVSTVPPARTVTKRRRPSHAA